MERVIKFRAWDTVNKEMHNSSFGGNYITFGGKIHNGAIQKDWILMQFTGMLDKNGTEIYEGDIVKSALIHHGNPGFQFISKIVYNSIIGAYQISYLNMNNAFVTDNLGFKYQLEIIGNIYENPELIK